MRFVYALALFGAAAAYLFLRTALPTLGMARIQLLAFLGVAGAIAVLGTGTPARVAAGIEALALGMALLAPGLEGRFLSLYKGSGVQSTYDFETNKGCRSVYQRWGRYSLCEILAVPGKAEYYGFYNDLFQWSYSPRMGFNGPRLGAVPILQTRPGESIAIIGSGGGRQVRLAERLGGRSVLAIELEPAVFEAVRSPEHLLRAFGRVYEAPGVRPVRAEARGYFEGTDERFDLIYLPSVGGYAQMMIEPGNMVRTFEAHRLLRDHLTERGVLAIWYPRGLDTRGVLTDQYVRTLRSLGMPASAFRNVGEWLILARRDGSSPSFEAAELATVLGLDPTDPGVADSLPTRHEVPDDPHFVPITDERPYLAGNVRYILSMRQVHALFALAGGLMATAGGAVWLALRRRGDPRILGRPYAAVGALAILIGANFLLVEHALVLALFRRLFVYDDALALAIVTFLCLSGLGSLAGPQVPKRWLLMLSAVGLGVLLLMGHRLPVLGVLLAAAPIALVTGTFFPALFDRAAAKPLAVFALDAIGAGLGAVLATFVPILWGFGVLFAVTATLFGLTAVADALFHRGLPAGSPSAEAPYGRSIFDH
jgi:SAM-dependent methyltransferase